MLIIKVNDENMGLITALNGGATPEIEKKVTYLLVDGTKKPRVITHPDLNALKKEQKVIETTLHNKVFVA